jgi:hypothetical protein
LTGWREIQMPLKAPVLIQSSFIIEQSPSDTFLDMSLWTKGIVFINGFNLGRYWNVGPTQSNNPIKLKKLNEHYKLLFFVCFLLISLC